MTHFLWTGALLLCCVAAGDGDAAETVQPPNDRLAFSAKEVPGYQLRYAGPWNSGASRGFEELFGRDVPEGSDAGGYTLRVRAARCKDATAAAALVKDWANRPMAMEWRKALATGPALKVDELRVNTAQMKSHGNYEAVGRVGGLAFHIAIQSRGDRVFKPLPSEDAAKVDTLVRRLVERHSQDSHKK